MTKHILVVDELESRFTIRQLLRDEGYTVFEADDLDDATAVLEQNAIDLALINGRLVLDSPDATGLQRVAELRARHGFLFVPLLSGNDHARIRQVIQAGAYDHLVRPLQPRTVLHMIRNALDRSQILRQVQQARQKPDAPRGLAAIVAGSEQMQAVKNTVRQVAAHDASVMLLGESGTGKEMVAQAIHHESGRREGPFVAINCGALPRELVESELFGHEKGAFTGASATRPGRFEQAHGGTLFLDEIGEMPLDAQVKLLRVLEERRIGRIGARREIDVDVRVVCATNADVMADVTAGRFRADLYYRLAVITIALPPLRERGEDIVLLAESFLRNFTSHDLRVNEETARLLKAHPWNGNVRELRNVIERAAILFGPRRHELDATLQRQLTQPPTGPRSRPGLAPEAALEPTTIHAAPLESQALDPTTITTAFPEQRDSEAEDGDNLLTWLEERAIWTAFVKSGYNKARAARLLGVERKAFERRLSKLRP